MAQRALAEVFEHPGPWTEQDYLALPEDNRRVELLDGGLLMSPNPASPHQRLLTRLWGALDQAAPPDLEVMHTVNVRVGPGKILIPDLVVLDTPGAEFVVTEAAHVVLALEITSPSSVAFDRAVKPGLYAAAGIPHYVRVEIGHDGPTAQVFERSGDRYVERAGVSGTARLSLDAPFPAVVDLAALAVTTGPHPA